MFAWVNPGDVGSVPQDVIALIDGAGLLERWRSDQPVNVPDIPEELMARLYEVDEAAAARTLVRGPQ